MRWISKDNKPKYSFKRLEKSFIYAKDGIITAFKTEQNLLIHFIALIINIFLIFFFKLSLLEACIILLLCTLVISLEMVNTAIEYAVNLVINEIHPLAKASKDIASSAVLVASFAALIIGLIIYVPKIIDLFR